MNLKQFLAQEYGVLSILGMRGCGKTYLAANELKFKDRVVYIDVVGAFRKFMPEMETIEFDAIPDDAETFTKILKDVKHKEFILDISELPRKYMCDVMDYLWEFTKHSKDRWAWVIDEVGELIPQTRTFYSEGLETAVRMGRNKGLMFVILISQRPQKVSKDCLALSDAYTVFKFVHNLDREAVREILGMSSDDFRLNFDSKLKSLGVGEYLMTDGLTVEEFKRSVHAAPVDNLPKEKTRWTPEHTELMKKMRAHGQSIKQIAEKLKVNEKTVEYHLYQKRILKSKRDSRKKKQVK